MSTPLEALMRTRAAGPPLASGGIGVTASLLGFFSSSATRPTTHLLRLAAPLNFHPFRSTPLNGWMALPPSSAETGMARTRAVKKLAIRNMRFLLARCRCPKVNPACHGTLMEGGIASVFWLVRDLVDGFCYPVVG